MYNITFRFHHPAIHLLYHQITEGHGGPGDNPSCHCTKGGIHLDMCPVNLGTRDIVTRDIVSAQGKQMWGLLSVLYSHPFSIQELAGGFGCSIYVGLYSFP